MYENQPPNNETETEVEELAPNSSETITVPRLHRQLAKQRERMLETVQFTKGDVMRELCARLPLNELGLPNYIYRTDLIPANLTDRNAVNDEERFQILDLASMSLEYFEGYPAQNNGCAFWTKLDFEPIEAYKAFAHYLGVVEQNGEGGKLLAPVRTFSAITELTGLSEGELKEYAHLYYWSFRVKAHDQFMVASFQKQKEVRTLYMEDFHFKQASNWLDKASSRLEEIFADEDLLDEMKPKEVFDIIERAMKMQRVSVGLPANGGTNQTKDDNPKNASLEVQLKTVAKDAGEEAKVIDQSAEVVDELLQDPENLEAVQQMVIRASMGS